MRKFTLFVASLFLAVGAMAQITDANQLSNANVTTLHQRILTVVLSMQSQARVTCHTAVVHTATI